MEKHAKFAHAKCNVAGIDRTIRQDTGVFICSAANSYGSDDMSIQLIVQEIPEAPRNVRVTEQQSRSIGISWTYPYAGNSPVSSYIIQYKPGAGKFRFKPVETADVLGFLFKFSH